MWSVDSRGQWLLLPLCAPVARPPLFFLKADVHWKLKHSQGSSGKGSRRQRSAPWQPRRSTEELILP